MKSLIAGVLVGCGVLAAQDASSLKQGEEVFAKSCGSAYCHGTRGTGAGAPRLAARGLDQAYINNTVSRGVPGTSMAGFTASLSRAELNAVIGYVASLNTIVPAVASGASVAATPRPLSETGKKGRDLFSDSLRGFGRCSTCHEVGGIGIPVAPPIAKVPTDVESLKALATPSVRTATLGNASMPALSISNGTRASILYDLTSTPPVQRSEAPGTVAWKDGSDWRHSSVIRSYSDSELMAVLAYLREVSK